MVVATLDDIWEGDMCSVMLDGLHLLLCNVAGVVVAFDNSCPHLGNPLSHGKLEGHVLTCAAHEWSFDVRTGEGINPASTCLRRYPVRLEADRVLVDANAGGQ